MVNDTEQQVLQTLNSFSNKECINRRATKKIFNQTDRENLTRTRPNAQTAKPSMNPSGTAFSMIVGDFAIFHQ